jgi:Skp family chaperone for outer membrane proteins
MSKLKKFVTSISFAFAVCVAAPVALAQDVLVLDTAKVFVDSKAGKDLSAKVNQIGKSMESELTPEKNTLQTEKNALDAKLQAKGSEAAVQADQALMAQGKAYTRKLETFARKSDKRARELVATERAALRVFAQKLKEASETVRTRRGGKIVLDKSNVYIVDASSDITQEVITQLDQIAPTIAVQRVTLPDQPQQTRQQ